MSDAPSAGPTADRPSAAVPPRQLTRIREDRVLGGVAAGLARYLGVDALVVRLGFVVGAVLGGVGVVAYVAGWLLIPEDTAGAPARQPVDARQVAGLVLLGAGLLVGIGGFGLWVDGQVVWALGLIAVGGSVLWLRARDARAASATPPDRPAPPAPPPSPAPPAPPPPGPWAAAASTTSGASTPVPYDPATPTAPWTAPGWRHRGPTMPPSTVPSERRPPSALGLLTICALLVGCGVALALDAAGAVAVGPGEAIGGALVVIGVGLVVGAWWGRARWLIAPGVALTLAAVAVSVLDVPLSRGIGERDYSPVTFAAVEARYELGIGSLELDLRDLDFTGRTEEVRASVGIGELNVWVPDGVRVVVDQHVGIGELVTFGEHEGGVDVDTTVARRGREGGGTLRLELDGGIGSVKVLHAGDGGPRS